MKTAELIDQIEENHASYNKQYKKDLKALKAIVIEEQLSDKPKFEIGKWYTEDDDTEWMIFIKAENERYGIGGFGLWFKDKKGINSMRSSFKEATDKEVEKALIKEAKKRGFKEGVRFEDLNGRGAILSAAYDISVIYFENSNRLLENGYVIFDNGVWAEIIENKLELNGKEVEITDSTISIGCVKHLNLTEWRSFVFILEKTGCTLSHDDIGEIKVSDLKALLK